MKWRSYFHKARAIAWIVFGVVSFAFGWAESIALVWAASVYANASSDWTAGEASDDTLLQEINERLKRIEARLDDGSPP